ncbi:hypothetical protein NIES4102_06880 [Chondrocystis sp. NIES-4102]|nr:hypothetical protein NIES4102_06880 [Chondrocystis sp. NIES-4102]
MKAKFIFSITTSLFIFFIANLSNSTREIENFNYNQSNIDSHLINKKQTQQVKPETLVKDFKNETRLKKMVKIQNIPIAPQESEEQQIFHQILEKIINRNIANKSMGEIMQAVAESFLGAKYTAGLLDQHEQETLIISLEQFDCLLFVETVLALSRNIALQDYSYQNFEQHIIDQRYWNGTLNGYCSRLHYFSEWIYDNQKRQNIKDISASLGGVLQSKKLDFMSKHRNLYPRLITNNANYQCIVEMESNLTKENIPTYYISKQHIKNIYKQLQPGDIIGVTTNITGLDVTHTGLVYYTPNGTIGLIHASPIGKVTIAPDLQDYVEKVLNSTGIVVARVIDPRSNHLNQDSNFH